MGLQLDERQLGISRSQLLNSFGIVGVAVVLLLVGLSMRDSAANATQTYLDEQSGIRAQIPINWLITSDDPGYVFQAQDPAAIPFKTVLRVSLLAVGEEASPRNVIDTLILQRAAQLSTYRVISIRPTPYRELAALEMNYAFVYAEANPFSSTEPLVIRGRDVVVLRRQQAVVITYLEERTFFEEHEYYFENFLANLEF